MRVRIPAILRGGADNKLNVPFLFTFQIFDRCYLSKKEHVLEGFLHNESAVIAALLSFCLFCPLTMKEFTRQIGELLWGK